MASIQRQEEYYKLNSERKIETEEARVFIEQRLPEERNYSRRN